MRHPCQSSALLLSLRAVEEIRHLGTQRLLDTYLPRTASFALAVVSETLTSWKAMRLRLEVSPAALLDFKDEDAVFVFKD